MHRSLSEVEPTTTIAAPPIHGGATTMSAATTTASPPEQAQFITIAQLAQCFTEVLLNNSPTTTPSSNDRKGGCGAGSAHGAGDHDEQSSFCSFPDLFAHHHHHHQQRAVAKGGSTTKKFPTLSSWCDRTNSNAVAEKYAASPEEKLEIESIAASISDLIVQQSSTAASSSSSTASGSSLSSSAFAKADVAHVHEKIRKLAALRMKRAEMSAAYRPDFSGFPVSPHVSPVKKSTDNNNNGNDGEGSSAAADASNNSSSVVQLGKQQKKRLAELLQNGGLLQGWKEQELRHEEQRERKTEYDLQKRGMEEVAASHHETRSRSPSLRTALRSLPPSRDEKFQTMHRSGRGAARTSAAAAAATTTTASTNTSRGGDVTSAASGSRNNNNKNKNKLILPDHKNSRNDDDDNDNDYDESLASISFAPSVNSKDLHLQHVQTLPLHESCHTFATSSTLKTTVHNNRTDDIYDGYSVSTKQSHGTTDTFANKSISSSNASQPSPSPSPPPPPPPMTEAVHEECRSSLFLSPKQLSSPVISSPKRASNDYRARHSMSPPRADRSPGGPSRNRKHAVVSPGRFGDPPGRFDDPAGRFGDRNPASTSTSNGSPTARGRSRERSPRGGDAPRSPMRTISPPPVPPMSPVSPRQRLCSSMLSPETTRNRRVVERRPMSPLWSNSTGDQHQATAAGGGGGNGERRKSVTAHTSNTTMSRCLSPGQTHTTIEPQQQPKQQNHKLAPTRYRSSASSTGSDKSINSQVMMSPCVTITTPKTTSTTRSSHREKASSGSTGSTGSERSIRLLKTLVSPVTRGQREKGSITPKSFRTETLMHWKSLHGLPNGNNKNYMRAESPLTRSLRTSRTLHDSNERAHSPSRSLRTSRTVHDSSTAYRTLSPGCRRDSEKYLGNVSESFASPQQEGKKKQQPRSRSPQSQRNQLPKSTIGSPRHHVRSTSSSIQDLTSTPGRYKQRSKSPSTRDRTNSKLTESPRNQVRSRRASFQDLSTLSSGHQHQRRSKSPSLRDIVTPKLSDSPRHQQVRSKSPSKRDTTPLSSRSTSPAKRDTTPISSRHQRQQQRSKSPSQQRDPLKLSGTNSPRHQLRSKSPSFRDLTSPNKSSCRQELGSRSPSSRDRTTRSRGRPRGEGSSEHGGGGGGGGGIRRHSSRDHIRDGGGRSQHHVGSCSLHARGRRQSWSRGRTRDTSEHASSSPSKSSKRKPLKGGRGMNQSMDRIGPPLVSAESEHGAHHHHHHHHHHRRGHSSDGSESRQGSHNTPLIESPQRRGRRRLARGEKGRQHHQDSSNKAGSAEQQEGNDVYAENAEKWHESTTTFATVSTTKSSSSTEPSTERERSRSRSRSASRRKFESTQRKSLTTLATAAAAAAEDQHRASAILYPFSLGMGKDDGNDDDDKNKSNKDNEELMASGSAHSAAAGGGGVPPPMSDASDSEQRSSPRRRRRSTRRSAREHRRRRQGSSSLSRSEESDYDLSDRTEDDTETEGDEHDRMSFSLLGDTSFLLDMEDNRRKDASVSDERRCVELSD